MRFTLPLIFSLCVLLTPVGAAADSIVIDGVRHNDIHVSIGSSMYYIQDPADGSLVSIPKSRVSESNITFTVDPEKRRKLREAWKQQRDRRAAGLPMTISYEDWHKEVEKDLPPQETAKSTIELISPMWRDGIHAEQSDDGVVHFSNQTASKRAPTSGRKMFLGRDGVAIMTNTPSEFTGKNEYIEVVIHYDPIDVPSQFREKKTRSTKQNVPTSFDDIVAYYARYYGIERDLIYAVIKAESNGNPYAVSPAGARGLMQLMPGTASDMGVNDIFDPAENIAGGTQYLSKLLVLYKGNVTLTLAGYNAGPGNVKKYGGVPPFKETQEYVRRVQQYQRQFKRGGLPQFDIASAKPVKKGYLPKTTGKYYEILLYNGLTVRAEKVAHDNGRYIYMYEGRTGHFAQDQVIAIQEPS